MNRDYEKRKFMGTNFQDLLFLLSDRIIFDSASKTFLVELPNGAEISVSVNRLLDIF